MISFFNQEKQKWVTVQNIRKNEDNWKFFAGQKTKIAAIIQQP